MQDDLNLPQAFTTRFYAIHLQLYFNMFHMNAWLSVTSSIKHSPYCEATIHQPVNKFPHFMGPAGSPPCSQQSTTCPHPEPDQSSTYYHPIS